MTILALHNNYDHVALNGQKPRQWYFLPETVQQKNGKPFFLPDYAVPCLMELHFAIRICRLGRNISPRFAHRYYDAMSAVPHFFSPVLLKEAQRKGMPWSLAMGFDTCLPIGDFLPLSPEEVQQQLFSVKINDSIVMQGDSSLMLTPVDQLIAEVSQYHTLRRGDLLLTGTPKPPIQVDINQQIKAFINETQVLAFNIK